MNWTELLRSEIESSFKTTEDLIDRVEEKDLDWKPQTGSNWMTTGQLVKHLTDACGAAMKGFVTGDWGMPEGFDFSQMSPEEMLPPAEKMPSIRDLGEAKRRLAEDKALALEMLEKTSEADLAGKMTTAPWDPKEVVLGRRLLHMIGHLDQHKGQLFYYLKLQGKPVDTNDLWGA
ncbi:MAG: DUF664 domain-containing protein [Candidatus Eisenbacteria bacterium]|nr:DUF664 domain-containing protein [Candidatus Latescibacterota bacterium]MBD3301162.1 DUF664 domain-containing protein [Candidatus Eisenbacteria bacterium]